MGEIEIQKGELDVLFRPKSVAVMGASSDEKKIGGRPIFYLKHYNFEGEIYPINPNYDVIQGLKAYKSLTDVPGDVDLALIALPSAMVEDAVRDCAAHPHPAVRAAFASFAHNVVYRAGAAHIMPNKTRQNPGPARSRTVATALRADKA